MFRVVAAPNAFKGSLSAADAARAIARGAQLASRQVKVIEAPMADGGDGTAEVLQQALRGTWQTATVLGPLGEKRRAHYLWVARQKLAVIEMAQASGLALVAQDKRNPVRTSTYGTGQLIADATRRGARRIVVAVGGSATTDCGAGALQALGARYYNASGDEIAPPMTGGQLREIAEAELFPALVLIDGVKLEIACDVGNPLLGPLGAARVFGPQKGAKPADVRVLEANVSYFFKMICERLGLDYRKLAEASGAGASGGLAGGLAVGCAGTLLRGAELVASLTGLEQKIRGTDLVITGEGALDEQTTMGKAPGEVARLAARAGVPVVALAGRVHASPTAIGAAGFAAAFSICDGPMSLEDSRADAAELLAQAAANVISLARMSR